MAGVSNHTLAGQLHRLLIASDIASMVLLALKPLL